MALITKTTDRKYIPEGATVTEVTKDGQTYFLCEQYAGRIVAQRERNYYDDSDFYVIVWDSEKKVPFEVQTWTTRYPSDFLVSEAVDATDEVREEYSAYRKAERERDEEYRRQQEARRPSTGKTIRVFKGRKVAKGTTGKCIWIGNSGYGMRCGLKDDQGNVFWTALSNIEVVVS